MVFVGSCPFPLCFIFYYDCGAIPNLGVIISNVFILYMKTWNKHRRPLYSKYTRKKKDSHVGVHGHIVENKKGWKTAFIHGSPYDRGFAHGFLFYEELARTLEAYPFLMDNKIKTTDTRYIEYSNQHIKPVVKKEFPEIYQEMEGIVAGANTRNIPLTIDFIVAWNSHACIHNKFLNTSADLGRCSAFIATGNATEDHKIVMGHTTHTNFIEGQLFHIILLVSPQKGHSFIMQTAAGLVASVSDWFVCSTGIIGCETTIHATNYEPQFGHPFFCRIRTAMQYATSLDEYAECMKTKNAGDYGCSWLFGDTNTNEIMLCELGLKKTNVQKTDNGIFYGMNSALDFELRTYETHDTAWNDISKSTGSRAVRLNELLYQTYFGKINLENGKKILADHYNHYSKKHERNRLAVCVHNETDGASKQPYNLRGCTDGKIINTDMAKEMSFYARFGSACGRAFSVKRHIKKHPKYKSWEPYLYDFKKYGWTKISFT
jgi:hypothetical protein